MSFFDQFQSPTGQGAFSAPEGGKTVQVTFLSLPLTPAEFISLPQATMQSPFDTAALFLAAMCLYPANAVGALDMLNHLKGSQPLSTYDKQFLADRMRGKDYLPNSFFVGATPANNYTPSQPYTLIVKETPYSYQEQNYAKLVLQSGGADSPRPITLRLAKDGRWYLWEQFLLSDIRPPENSNPWA